MNTTLTDTPRTEKNLATLVPKAQDAARRFLAELRSHLPSGVTVEIISGSRSYSEQNALYAQGRTAKGPKVTNARGGQSNHNFGVAWDIGFFKGGKYLDESPLYAFAGGIGRGQGLEWGGDWKSIQDEPHFQLRTGLTLAEMRDRHDRGIAIA